ncbi:cold shock domain-containing protein [Salicola sp. Rm-C-2C1-2]|uniref:cold shock domain-containing protein n=1 Tax=Salicola sp. Rm-C-2C1-2 TaxID=3141321 RepID=UPI0032E39560
MHQGKVKWFNNAKGYGFIIEEGESEDLFVHFSSIQMEGYKTLKAGQRVEFEKQPSAKGIHAVNIIPHETTSRRKEASDPAASPQEPNDTDNGESRSQQPESRHETA